MGKDGTRSGRAHSLVNYAVVNKHGFRSAISARPKNRVKKRGGSKSLNNSPTVESNIMDLELLLKSQTKLNKMADEQGRKDMCQGHEVTSPEQSTSWKKSDENKSVVDMSELNLSGMSKEEKLHILREKIAELEEEKRQKEEEEDEEVKALLEKHNTLRRRLSKTGTPTTSKKSGKGKQVKVPASKVSKRTPSSKSHGTCMKQVVEGMKHK